MTNALLLVHLSLHYAAIDLARAGAGAAPEAQPAKPGSAEVDELFISLHPLQVLGESSFVRSYPLARTQTRSGQA
ncbi:hypothetical protein EVAR_80495_1 [Eumeta japonica]|uniref:Uncharacterized protein n=1 Tax=Eumeta variegata TaxID=151549 RepID=A0A4C1ZH25_EUMVA|nr:hypothetical protein EVAR_80495_1 [Eumeta japonica]